MLAKFYVFRPSALALFLALAGLVALVSVRLPDGLAGVKALLVFGLVATFAWRTFKTQVDRFRDAGAAKLEHSGLVAAVAAHTRPGDVVLIEPFQEFEPRQLRLHRDIPRPTLVSRKFLPTNPADVLRWNAYLKMRRQLFSAGCSAPSQPVRWLVTLQPETAARLAGCGPPVWQGGTPP